MMMRHAKSSWDDASVKDFDRPLAPRGEKAAPVMGHFLKMIDHVPDYIIASPAKRAKHTANLVLDICCKSVKIIWDETLYTGSGKDYGKALQKVSEEYSNVLIIGHNPSISEAAVYLFDAHGTSSIHFSTASIVCMQVNGLKWSEVLPGKAQLNWMITPKLLKMLGFPGD